VHTTPDTNVARFPEGEQLVLFEHTLEDAGVGMIFVKDLTESFSDRRLVLPFGPIRVPSLTSFNLRGHVRATAKRSQTMLAGKSKPSVDPELDEVVRAATLTCAGAISSGSMGR
jgi:hypothetical protein